MSASIVSWRALAGIALIIMRRTGSPLSKLADSEVSEVPGTEVDHSLGPSADSLFEAWSGKSITSNSLLTSVKEWDVDPQVPYSSAIRADTAEDSNRHGAATKPVQLWQSLAARAFSLCGNATAPQSPILHMSCCLDPSVGPLTGRRKNHRHFYSAPRWWMAELPRAAGKC